LTPPEPSEPQPPRATLQPMPDISLDLGDDDTPPAPRTVATATVPAAEPAAPPMAEAVDLDFDVEPPYPASQAARAPALDAELPPLDLGSLSLDLGEPAATPVQDLGEAETDDPLATKLALAEEFRAIGDDEGARALAEEVLAEASGPLKTRAQRFLAELG
jgi:pilus assembly protein FimV